MKTILIIEDDFYIRDLYAIVFKKAGYDVSLATDGEEGIAQAKNKPHDVILLDIMIPKITGIDVLKALREETSSVKDTPIFLISNLGQDTIIKEAFSIGADGYFLKSQLTPKQIVDEINSLLSNQGK